MFRAINPPPRQRQLAPVKTGRSAKFKKADVVRAVEAVRNTGMAVAEIEIRLDGSAIRIISTDAQPRNDGDLFSRWEHRL